MKVKRPVSIPSNNLRALLDATKRETRILGAIEKWVLAQPDDRNHRVIHPSEVIEDSWCPLAAYHWLYGDEPTRQTDRPKLRLQNIFDEGHTIHDKWQRRLWGMGALYGRWRCAACKNVWFDQSPQGCPACRQDIEGIRYVETPLSSSRYRISGHTDGWIKGLGPDALLEVKSIGPGTIRHYAPALMAKHDGDLSRAFRDIQQPFSGHYKQIEMYLWLANDMVRAGTNLPPGFGQVTEAVVIYESKADQDYHEFVVAYDPESVAPYLDKAERLVAALNADEIPECVTGKDYGCPACSVFAGVLV